MSNAIVYRCVRMIAEAAASVPFLLYDGAAELDAHPLLSLLLRPNPEEDGSQFFARWVRLPAMRRQRLYGSRHRRGRGPRPLHAASRPRRDRARPARLARRL
ncbi:MAG: phage portal protein [Rhizomicrobium sp.]